MAVDPEQLREKLDRVFARHDMFDACKSRDFGAIVRLLNRWGITQGQIASMTGISQGRISEYKTGKRIPTASSTVETFADGLGMPARLRLALGLAPTDGAEAVRRDGGLDMPTDAFEIHQLAEAVGRRGDDLKRRELLSLAARLGSSVAVAESDVWERLMHALTKPGAANESIVHALEYRSAGFHQLNELIPAPLLLKGLITHLQEITTLLNGLAVDPHDDLRNRLIIAAGESALIAGWAASDMSETVTARNFYGTAERAAKEASDSEILACALAYRSYIPSTKGSHGRARALLSDALEALSTSSSPGTISWIAARHAEESAALGDSSQALKSWTKADDAFSIADTEDDRVWTRFLNQDRFDSLRIATFAQIPSKLDEAQQAAESVLSRLVRDGSEEKRGAVILESLAVAHISHGSMIEGCKLARAGLAMVRETRFAMWLPKFEAIGQTLRRYQQQPLVRSYLEELAMTKRQFASSRR
jgi:transcriptional regulator with XRE-family HTH domain